MINLGYACISVTLSKQKISTNRTMMKRTFKEKGVPYAAELALKNVQDLEKIVKWNEEQGIKFFRMSSDMFPWASEYDILSLPNIQEIAAVCKRVGEYAKSVGQRLTFHPGPFNVLCSPNPKVVENTIKDLENHGKVMDLLGLDLSTYNKMNIHCNGVFGDKLSAMERFCENFQKLSKSVRSRLTVENDDKASMYSVTDLMYIHQSIDIPIVFDYHHHQFCTGGLTEREALDLAVSTWKEKPIVHHSESKALHENDKKVKPQAHSDYVFGIPDLYGHQVDIMLEAKQKELALLKIRNSIK